MPQGTPFVYPYARAYDCPGMLERAAACGGAIARYRNIYGAEHGSEGTQQGNGSRGWRGRDRRRLQAPDGVHRTVGPVLGRHRTPQIASGPLDSVHGIGAAGHDRAVLVGARYRGAGRLMDGGEPEFPRSQRRGADFMDGDHRGAHRTRTDGRGREEMAVGGHFRDRPCRGAIRRRHVPAELQLLERHLRDVR